MKKNTLAFFAAFFLCMGSAIYAQYLSEGFESGTMPPTGWTLNSSNSGFTWYAGTDGPNTGTYAATVDYDPALVPQNEDLITPSIDLTTATSPELVFSFSNSYYWSIAPESNYDVTISVDDGTTTTPIWSDDDLGMYDNYTHFQVSIDLSAYVGSNIQIIFNYSGADGAATYIDDIEVREPPVAPECATSPITPTDGELNVDNSGFILSWTAPASGPAPTGYDVYVGTDLGNLTLLFPNEATTSIDVTADFATTYYWQVIPLNNGVEAEGCSDVWSFTTADPPLGAVCSDPIVISTVPYNTTDDTANYGDDYENGESSCSLYYMSGDDVVYSFTPTNDGSYNISLTNLGGTYSGIHVLDNCPENAPNCIGFEGNSGTADRVFDVNLVSGTTYYVIISTWAAPQSTTYTLNISENTCTDATVAYNVVSDCNVSGGFNIEVDITDMGSATALTVSDDQGSSPQPATGITTLTFGPYTLGTEVVITVSDDDDSNCVQDSDTLTLGACPPSNNDCANATSIVQEVETIDATSATPTAGTIEGATASGLPAEACGIYTGTANDDVWYSFVALTENVNITYEINGTTFFDGVAQLYSGTCGTLTNIGCADDSITTAPVVEEIQATGLIVGETYFTRIYQYSGTSNTVDKTFDVKIWSPDALSTNEYVSLDAFMYYPNPVNNNLLLTAQRSIQDVAVYNMLGQEVLRIAPNTVNSDVDMSSLQSGTYFVKVTVGNAIKTIKIIKK